MSNIDTRAPFFPRSRDVKTQEMAPGERLEKIKKNSAERASEINEKTSGDAKVSIPEGVKDFSKIKKVAMTSEGPDNTEKIEQLKAQIKAGTYQVDYDALADKILNSEF